MEELILKALLTGLGKLLAEGGPMSLIAGVCYFAHKALIKEKDARLKDTTERTETLVRIIQENTEAQHALKSSLEHQSILINTLMNTLMRKRA